MLMVVGLKEAIARHENVYFLEVADTRGSDPWNEAIKCRTEKE